jgi:hypothetical protein
MKKINAVQTQISRHEAHAKAQEAEVQKEE